MANTRKSAKRARQADKRQTRNQIIKSSTRTAVKKAVDAIKSADKQDAAQLKQSYVAAVKALDKAVSKGSIPKRRASRKISRLTRLLKKTAPAAYTS